MGLCVLAVCGARTLLDRAPNTLGPFFPDASALYNRNARPYSHVHTPRVRVRASAGVHARPPALTHARTHACNSPAEAAKKWDESFSILRIPEHACHAAWDPSQMIYNRNGR